MPPPLGQSQQGLRAVALSLGAAPVLDTASNARPAIIRAQEGTTTGISAADRAATFRALASPTAVPSDFNRPGHVFPL